MLCLTAVVSQHHTTVADIVRQVRSCAAGM